MSQPISPVPFENKSSSLQQFEQDVFDAELDDGAIDRVYDRWAKEYEQLYVGFKSHHYIPHQLRQWLPDPNTTRILDVGAGTGLVGEQLLACGFSNLDALDYSANMLEEAKKKDVYRNFICDHLGHNRLAIQDDTYDGVVSMGVFLPSHVNEDSFGELVRIVKPGGVILLTIRSEVLREFPDFRRSLETAMEQYQDKGLWVWRVRRVMSSSEWEDEPGVVYIFQVA